MISNASRSRRPHSVSFFSDFGCSKGAIDTCKIGTFEGLDQVQDDLESSDVSTQPISEFLPYAIKP